LEGVSCWWQEHGRRRLSKRFMEDTNPKEKSKETKIQSKNQNPEIQEQYRVVISKEANWALEEVTRKVNLEFNAGLVTKSDVANYFLADFKKLISDSDVRAIRSLHFDEKKVLNSILKKEDELPEEIKRAIRDHYGLVESPKKRGPKAAPDLSTRPPVDNESLL
jgi:hypothetical protein